MKLNTNSYNGIRIIDSMNLSVPKNRKFLNIIPLLIISFLGIWGTVFSYITMFDITINSTLINFCTILFFVILLKDGTYEDIIPHYLTLIHS